jgi:hypothetical protein
MTELRRVGKGKDGRILHLFGLALANVRLTGFAFDSHDTRLSRTGFIIERTPGFELEHFANGPGGRDFYSGHHDETSDFPALRRPPMQELEKKWIQ